MATFYAQYGGLDIALASTATLRFHIATLDAATAPVNVDVLLSDTRPYGAGFTALVSSAPMDLDVPMSAFGTLDLDHIAEIGVQFQPAGPGNLAVGPFKIVQ
jgi:hypothetical protein